MNDQVGSAPQYSLPAYFGPQYTCTYTCTHTYMYIAYRSSCLLCLVSLNEFTCMYECTSMSQVQVLPEATHFPVRKISVFGHSYYALPLSDVYYLHVQYACTRSLHKSVYMYNMHCTHHPLTHSTQSSVCRWT